MDVARQVHRQVDHRIDARPGRVEIDRPGHAVHDRQRAVDGEQRPFLLVPRPTRAAGQMEHVVGDGRRPGRLAEDADAGGLHLAGAVDADGRKIGIGQHLIGAARRIGEAHGIERLGVVLYLFAIPHRTCQEFELRQIADQLQFLA
jgi:GNAT superfamily N-acetyltransferase